MSNNVLADSLKRELMGNCTTELLDNLLDSLQVIELFGYSDHEVPLTNLLEEVDIDIKIEGSYRIVEEHLIAICTLHRITVNEFTTLDHLAKFVRALWLMQGWEDANRIVEICTADAEDEERVAAICDMVGELSEHEFLDIIEGVDPSFLGGLKRLYTEDNFAIIEDPSDPIDPQHLERIRLWRTAMRAKDSLAFRMMKVGYQPGSLFKDYISKVSTKLQTLENKEIAFEVCCFLMLSRDGWHNAMMTWRENSSILELEPQDLTSVDSYIVKEFSIFDRMKGKNEPQ